MRVTRSVSAWASPAASALFSYSYGNPTSNAECPSGIGLDSFIPFLLAGHHDVVIRLAG
jgi:hypothetical protein